MRRNRLLSLAVVALVCCTVATSAWAQNRRPSQTFFVRPHVGLSSYVGDHDKSLFSTDGGFPFNAGLELGYQFTPPLSLGVGYQIGQYSGINPLGDDDIRHTVRLLLRFTFGDEVGPAPYVQTGAHATFGKATRLVSTPPDVLSEASETAAGALFGVGLDVPVSNRTSVFFEVNTHAAFPDDAADGREDTDGASFDLLNTFVLGLRINFKSAAVAPEVFSIDGPARLEAGDAGTFLASTNDAEATRPVEYRWDWGDGTFSSGLSTTHTYASPGTYTVRFEASNAGGSAAQTKTVQVVPKPVPATILSVTASPQEPDTRTPVRFSASVRGDAPLSYSWTFGDQEGSSEAAPTHTFSEPGTYTVTLDLSNGAGTDTRTLNLTVLPYEAEICREITELATAYFGRNASTLTDEARRLLRDNLQILRECPNMNARVVGYAAPGERNPQRLSEDRARAVEQFYTSNGVSPNRLMTVGEGQAAGVTSKKEGAAQWQRVDTIPLR